MRFAADPITMQVIQTSLEPVKEAHLASVEVVA